MSLIFSFYKESGVLFLCLKVFQLLNGWKLQSRLSLSTGKIVVLLHNKLGVETISRFIKAYCGNNFLVGDIMNVQGIFTTYRRL